MPSLPEGYLLNDETLAVLGRISLSHAEAGADIVAPSGMVDGMVAAIRGCLDGGGFSNIPDHVIRGEVRLSLLRPVSRGGAGRAPFRGPPEPPDGSGQRP